VDPKLLTEDGWKAIALKFKVKDKDLQRALSVYETIDEDEPDDQLKELATITRLATNLKRDKEIAASPPVVKYLTDLLSAVQAEQREIAKTKAVAAKIAAVTQKKADAEAKQRGKEDDEEDEEDEEEEEEEEGDYHVKLVAAFQKLKGAKDAAYQFIICDAKPHSAVMLAKKINAKHKEELSKVTGGSKRFLHVGTVRFENGKYNFAMEKPVTGLARKLQDSIKHFTGKKLPILVGNETAEDDEGAAAPAEAAAPPKLPRPDLATAPEVWQGTRGLLEKNINALKRAIQAQSGDEQPEFLAEIKSDLEQLNRIVAKLDGRLADSLSKAKGIKDPAGRKAELQNSKAILAGYIQYVKSEPLIDLIDTNPFGVKTNLKPALIGSLTNIAQAIG
jgi:hypothetical protein